MTVLQTRLTDFARAHRFTGKGALSVALLITDKARTLSFPIDPESMIAQKGGGQVAGLSSGAVQKILKRRGVDRILSQEGGRTSRGSIANMRAYVALLNELAHSQEIDLDLIENFWVERVLAYFAGKPFKLRLDPAQGLRPVIRHILAQATQRQKDSTGTNYAGAVMQHLVGAKLDCALVGKATLHHHSFSTSDEQSGRAGDFLIGDTAIHVTTHPTEALIRKCGRNLDAGLRAVIVTSQRGTLALEQMAENANLAGRIDVFEIEQFISLNIYELGVFVGTGHQAAIIQIVAGYNKLIEAYETDPSLLIET